MCICLMTLLQPFAVALKNNVTSHCHNCEVQELTLPYPSIIQTILLAHLWLIVSSIPAFVSSLSRPLSACTAFMLLLGPILQETKLLLTLSTSCKQPHRYSQGLTQMARSIWQVLFLMGWGLSSISSTPRPGTVSSLLNLLCCVAVVTSRRCRNPGELSLRQVLAAAGPRTLVA